MRTVVLRILVFLCLGCVVTAIVALGCFLLIDGNTTYAQPLGDTTWILDHGGTVPSAEEWGPQVEEFRPAFGVDRRVYRAGGRFFAYRAQSGWPARALRGGWWMNSGDVRTYVDALPINLSDSSLVVNESDYIPVGVGLFGWIIDTIFYAVFLWLPIEGPFVMRRFFRRDRLESEAG